MDYLAQAKNAFTTMKLEKGEDRTVFDSSISLELQERMLEIMRKSEVGFDISYDMMSDAVNNLPSTMDDYDSDSIYENEQASIYTKTRLAYLTIYNQEEITQKVKEYGCDIATACAFWYDEQVQNMFFALISELEDMAE